MDYKIGFRPCLKLPGIGFGPRDFCDFDHHRTFAQCLKITEKVSFNIASEASCVYILSGQKLIKNAKNGPFWRVFENLKLAVKQCYQTSQFFIGQKLVENAKIQKYKCDILSNFQTMCLWKKVENAFQKLKSPNDFILIFLRKDMKKVAKITFWRLFFFLDNSSRMVCVSFGKNSMHFSNASLNEECKEKCSLSIWKKSH